MLIFNLEQVGSLELLYILLKDVLKQIPTIFKMLSTAPVIVLQFLALGILIFGMNFIFAVVDKITAWISRLNDKL